MPNVLVYKPGQGSPEKFEDAYLQADDSTVLIRQQRSNQYGGKPWTTTAVFAPGTYTEVRYEYGTLD